MLGTNPDAFGVWMADAPGNVPWRAFLDGAADAGYQGVELGPYGYLPTDPIELTDALEQRSLRMIGGYVSAAFHERDGAGMGVDSLRQVASSTRAAGAEFLMLLANPATDARGRVPLEGEPWKRMIRGLLEAARVAADEYGLQTVFHPHVGMAVETPEETERFVADTEGRIGICLDTGQYSYAGGDPAAFIERHGRLVTYLHLRDVDPQILAACLADRADFRRSCERGVFCEPGEGLVDFPAVSAAARAAGFDGPVVVERSLLGCTLEQARSAAARAARVYRALGFADR